VEVINIHELFSISQYEVAKRFLPKRAEEGCVFHRLHPSWPLWLPRLRREARPEAGRGKPRANSRVMTNGGEAKWRFLRIHFLSVYSILVAVASLPREMDDKDTPTFALAKRTHTHT